MYIRLSVPSTDGEDVEVRSSISENVVREGGRVTLNCTADCSFHQLDVNWYINDHLLKETGPVLHLRDLTMGNTGNYTCSLDPSRKKRSLPCSLLVEADEREPDLGDEGEYKVFKNSGLKKIWRKNIS